MEFLVDSGAERSIVQTVPRGCAPSSEKIEVIGAKGDPFSVLVIKGVEIESPSRIGIGSLLLVPEAEYNLLGRDLMVELGISLEIKDRELKVKLYQGKRGFRRRRGVFMWIITGSGWEKEVRIRYNRWKQLDN